MIRSRILGIPLSTRTTRRYFVLAFWLAEAVIFAALSRFPIPMELARTPAFLVLLGLANTLPLLLGGISVGGAVAFYEAKPFQLKPDARSKLERDPKRARLVLRLLSYYRPADEREAQLRDAAHHRSHRMLFWSLPQSILLWTLPDVDLEESKASSPEAQC